MKRVWGLFCVSLALAGCSTTQVAPVVDLMGSNAAATGQAYNKAAGSAKINGLSPATHVVQKGETLYSIALEHGLDYRELAAWNHLSNLNHIQVGQSLRVTAPGAAASGSPSQNPASQDLATTQGLVMSLPIVTTQALPDNNLIKQPQAIKLPYSKSASAQVAKLDAATAAHAQPGSAGANLSEVAAKPLVTVNNGSVAGNNNASSKAVNDTGLDWTWPATGPVIAKFGDANADKGIDIGGIRGQPIFAAAAGKVVYSGAGLHGYGKLVIIKHNAIYLTAYAHNEQILVKEGQTVSRGQEIAEMGDSDADRVELHFEVRQMGKPVDPLIFLPEAKK